MTDTLATTALAVSAFPLSIVVKATGIMAVALLAMRGMRRSRASMRHLVLASSFVATLVFPVVGLIVPAITVPVESFVTPSAVLPITIAPANGAAPVPGAAAPSAAVTPESHAYLLSPSAWLISGWAAAAVVCLLPVLFTPIRLRRLRRTAQRWREAENVARSLGGDRSVAVLVHEEVSAPVICGVARRAIVMPTDALLWNDGEIRRALVHELEHIRRVDWPVHIVTRIVCALYWFHPLIWVAWRRLGLEAERACDDAVLRMDEPTAYAQQLVTLARRHVMARAIPALSMAPGSDLAARVTAVLDATQARGRLGLARASVVIATAVLLTAAVAPLRAKGSQTIQSQAADAPAFDVASIRENTSGDQGQSIRRQPGGRIVTSNYALRSLILSAYGLQPQQLVGGPDWIDSARYDIIAQASREFPIAEPGTVGPPQLMMQRLLQDRFKLAVHTETRELPIYALTTARSDGRLGPQIRTAAIDCQAVMSEALKKAQGGVSPPTAPQRADGGPGCGMRFDGRRVTAGGTSMAALARNLAGPVGRLVVDRTGLAGGFDFDLEFTADLPAAAAAGLPPPDANAPSIFTALQEQLGLKLEATRAPVEVLAIDGVERPTEN